MSINLSAILCCGGVPTNAGFSFRNVQVFDTNGTWSKPSNVNIIRVIAVGAGGGGAASYVRYHTSAEHYLETTIGGGGGAGQYVDAIYTVSGDIIVTIGNGGAGAPEPTLVIGSPNSYSDGVYSGYPGEDTILSGGLNLVASGGGGGLGKNDDVGSGISNPTLSKDIGSTGGGSAQTNSPLSAPYDYLMRYANGGVGGGAGASVTYLHNNLSGATSYSFQGNPPIKPLHPYTINGYEGVYPAHNTMTFITPMDAGIGIGGIAGGGGGAGIIYSGKDGAGRGGRCGSASIHGNPPQSEIDGTDALDNTGSGGGAGGVVEYYSSGGIGPIHHGRGGNGGSGLVIIMW